MKELKKEVKIVLGIAISVILISLIATIIILAVSASRKGSQLFSQRFTWVETTDGQNATFYDGAFIAMTDGGYVLMREDRTLSKKYSSLKMIDTKLYEFTTFDGKAGRIDSDGKEVFKADLKGKVINDTVIDKSFNFYIEIKDGKQYAVKGNNKSIAADKIYTYSEAAEFSSDPIELKTLTEEGIFIGEIGGEKFLMSVYNSDFKISSLKVEGIGKGIITVNDGSFYSYAAPNLESIERLEGVEHSHIYEYKGQTAFYQSGRIKILGEESVSVEADVIPTQAVNIDGKHFILKRVEGTITAIAYDGTSVYKGEFQEVDSLYRVDNVILNSKIVKASGVGDCRYAGKIEAKDKSYYVLDGSLYSYDGIKVTLLLENMTTTYGKDDFIDKSGIETLNHGLINTYHVYFKSGNKVYNYNLKETASGTDISIIGINLLKINGKFTDLNNKNSIEAEKYFEVIRPDGKRLTGEYVFYKNNALYTYGGKVMDVTNDNIGVVVKSDDGGYIAASADTFFTSGNKVFNINNHDFFGINAEGKLYIADGGIISLYKITSSECSKAKEYSFGKITRVDVFEHGIVVYDINNRAGLIDNDLKLRIKPIYEFIEPAGKFIVAKQNGKYAVCDNKGKTLTDSVYESYKIMGDFVLLTNNGGTGELANSRGNIVAKNIEGGYINVVNYVYNSGKYIVDSGADYYFIFTDGYYKLIKAVIN